MRNRFFAGLAFFLLVGVAVVVLLAGTGEVPADRAVTAVSCFFAGGTV